MLRKTLAILTLFAASVVGTAVWTEEANAQISFGIRGRRGAFYYNSYPTYYQPNYVYGGGYYYPSTYYYPTTSYYATTNYYTSTYYPSRYYPSTYYPSTYYPSYYPTGGYNTYYGGYRPIYRY